MTTRLAGLLVLNADVLLVPVEALPDDTRAQIECAAGDFALSRPQARTGSKVVDADAAALLTQFTAPRSVSEAVILFARERELDPGDVLEGAHGFLRGLVDAGFLVAGDDAGAAPRDPHGPQLAAGVTVAGAVVLRTLAVLDDTEIALVQREGEEPRVLKVARPGSHETEMSGRLSHEAAYLRTLDGAGAPYLYGELRLDGRPALEMSFVPGADLATAAAEWRDEPASRPQLLALLQRVAHAYASLHARGMLHGDVHPRNVLVTPDGGVHLVDFGVAAPVHPGALPAPTTRGGIPFFYEPEFAAAARTGRPRPASPAGEQFAVAAMLWFVATGVHSQAFRLGRDEMLDDIANGAPRTFTACGVAPWPELEAVLTRGLSRDPAARHPSMAAFAGALDAVTAPASPPAVVTHRDVVDDVLARTWPGGAWWDAALQPPSASVMYGGAGIALGLRHIAERRGDATTLAAAALWATRAGRAADDDAFYHAPIQISPDVVGRVSPFHTRSGVQVVRGLVAASQGDAATLTAAIQDYLDATAEPTTALDLTVGLGSVALGAAWLLEATDLTPVVDTTDLRARGDASVLALWQTLSALPTIADAGIEYTGAAHGWAGFAHAALVWHALSGLPLPSSLPRRLDELARLARPVGRGLEWPWTLRHGATMPGWCNGSAGLVAMWHLAHDLTGDRAHAERAARAAWHAWEAPEGGASLCCGLAGRAYALLAHYRATGDRAWLRRAAILTDRARRDPSPRDEYPHSLYKGALALAVLNADLERPDDASMPFFELRPGWQRRRDIRLTY